MTAPSDDGMPPAGARRRGWLDVRWRQFRRAPRPVVRAVDKIVTGSIAGTLTDAATTAGIPGATVMAEVVDGAGHVTVVNSAVTGADGSYSIGLLPIDQTYYVVSQPVSGSSVYAPKASGGLTLTAAAPIASFSAAFATTSQVGSVLATVTPVAADAQDDRVYALASVLAGTTPMTLIVRGENATVAGASETAELDDMPAGSYQLFVERSSTDTSGNVTVTDGAAVPVVVTSGGTSNASLTAP